MANRGQIRKNGGPIIGISRIFYNSRDRQKYIGSVGELVADVCECTTVDGGMVANLYLHIGCNDCGGIPVGGLQCGPVNLDAETLCAAMQTVPSGSPIEGVDLADDICDAMASIPSGAPLLITA